MADRKTIAVADDGAEWARAAKAVGLPWPPRGPGGPRKPRKPARVVERLRGVLGALAPSTEPLHEGWSEADHPRHPAGEPIGGRFAPKDRLGLGNLPREVIHDGAWGTQHPTAGAIPRSTVMARPDPVALRSKAEYKAFMRGMVQDDRLGPGEMLQPPTPGSGGVWTVWRMGKLGGQRVATVSKMPSGNLVVLDVDHSPFKDAAGAIRYARAVRDAQRARDEARASTPVQGEFPGMPASERKRSAFWDRPGTQERLKRARKHEVEEIGTDDGINSMSELAGVGQEAAFNWGDDDGNRNPAIRIAELAIEQAQEAAQLKADGYPSTTFRLRTSRAKSGLLTGVMATTVVDGKSVHVHYLAGNPNVPGAGARLLAEAARDARAIGGTVELEAVQDAVQFYQKMGMTRGELYYDLVKMKMSAKRARELADAYYGTADAGLGRRAKRKSPTK